MVVAVDVVGAGAVGGVISSLAWNHVLGAKATAILVWESGESTTATLTATATVGATSMTLLGMNQNYYFNGGFWCSCFLWGLLFPPTGSQTITTTLSQGGCYGGGNSVSYLGVGSFDPVVVSNAGTTGAPTLTIPSIAGNMVAGGYSDYVTTFSSLSGNSRFNVPFGGGSTNLSFCFQDAAGAPSVSLTTAAGVAEWGALGINLNPLPYPQRQGRIPILRSSLF